MEQQGVVAGNFGLSFLLNFFSIFVHISGTILPITLIGISLERSFPPTEVEYKWCQFWSKVMTSEVEERPTLVTASYGQHRSQWVKAVDPGQSCKLGLDWFFSLVPWSPRLLTSYIISVKTPIFKSWKNEHRKFVGEGYTQFTKKMGLVFIPCLLREKTCDTKLSKLRKSEWFKNGKNISYSV